MAIDLNHILRVAVKGGASDIHFKAGMPPMFRVNGKLLPLKDGQRVPPDEVAAAAMKIMKPIQQELFNTHMDVDFAYGVPGTGRFRCNVFQQRGTVSMVLRVIPHKVPSIDELLLPDTIKRLAEEKRGLVLCTGSTGSGKSTTLASMVEYINGSRTSHIVTIEDPVEFLIRDRRSLINQRELGTDCTSFSKGLRSALRQDPDVILVGEMRDLETIEIALTAAETGHLVFSTLHTLDAAESIMRIVSSFPSHQQKQVRLQLAGILKGVISQRLVPRADGKGRVPAVEVMLNTARMKELIVDEDRFRDINDAIAKGRAQYGMQTFDQSLLELYEGEYITYDEAIGQATNPDDLALLISGVEDTGGKSWDEL